MQEYKSQLFVHSTKIEKSNSHSTNRYSDQSQHRFFNHKLINMIKNMLRSSHTNTVIFDTQTSEPQKRHAGLHLLKKPRHYVLMKPRQRAAVRFFMRQAAARQGTSLPLWVTSPTNISSFFKDPLKKPTDYDLMTVEQKADTRARALKAAAHQGIKAPLWAFQLDVKHTASTQSILPPSQYVLMSNEQQSNARNMARQLSKKQGLPVPKWAFQQHVK